MSQSISLKITISTLFLYCVSIIQAVSLKLSPANLVQIVVLNRAQAINIRGYMPRAY